MTIWQPTLDEQGPVYLAITRALESDIRTGSLRPGDRLPPHRELADTLGVNVGTVTRAFGEARRRGLIRGEVGRGTFVSRPSSPPLSSPRANRTGSGTIDLSINLPLVQPGPNLAEGLRKLAEHPDLEREMGYRDPAGSMSVRRAGARWLERLGVQVPPDQVVTCAGAQHAILVALSSVAGPGDLILTEALTYPGVVGAAKMLGLRIRAVAMDEAGLIPESLEEICRAERPRLLYCMPTLQNPTTAQLSEGRRSRIAEIAEACDLIVVQDDIQGGIIDDPVPSLASLVPDRVLTIAGVSKNLAPGVRIAFLCGSPSRISRLSELIWSSVWMATPIGAELVAQWIEDGTADAVIEARRREMDLRHDLASAALASLRYQTRPGAYHLWLSLPDPWTAQNFTSALLNQGIVVSPSEAFLAQPGEAPPAVRISLTSVEDPEVLDRALQKIAKLAAGPEPSRSVRL